jgi:tRNA(fMet)-specific endonuclease VapC
VTVDINDAQVIDAYARIDAQSQKPLGRKMGKNDLWIAATTHVSGATLMTTDADFDHLAGLFLGLIKIDANTGHTI